MATLILPVTSDSSSSLIVTLDGTNYLLDRAWNDRDEAWYMDISLDDGTLLAAGRKLVVDWPLTGIRDTDPRMPPGVIFCTDTSGKQIDPGLNDLGARVPLCYEEATSG